jgi:Family of unknown function (DUF6279)
LTSSQYNNIHKNISKNQMVSTSIVGNFNTRTLLFRGPLIVCLLLATLLASACSVISLGYSALPTYASWQLDRYYSFDDTQREQVRLALNNLQNWHRKSELPEYRKLLLEVRNRSKRNLQENDMQWMRDQLEVRWNVTAEKIALPMAELTLTLKPEQLERMRKRMEDQNKENREKYLQADLKERSAERLKRTVDRYENFFPDLTASQEQLIQGYLDQMPPTDDTWYKERLARQKTFTQLLDKIRKEQTTKEQGAKWLKEYMLAAGTTPDPARQAYFDKAVKVGDVMTVKLFASLSAEQRAGMAKKLDGWIAELSGLMGA